MSGRAVGMVTAAPAHKCDISRDRETGLHTGNNSPKGEIRVCDECGAFWIKDKKPFRRSHDPLYWGWRQVTKWREKRRIKRILMAQR